MPTAMMRYRLRRAPMFKLGVERLPLEAGEDDWASAPTLSRLEPQWRPAQTSIGSHRPWWTICIARYAEPPAAIGLDLDHV